MRQIPNADSENKMLQVFRAKKVFDFAETLILAQKS